MREYEVLESTYFNGPDYRLSNWQIELLERVSRPQLREDIYLGIIGKDQLTPRRPNKKNKD